MSSFSPVTLNWQLSSSGFQSMILKRSWFVSKMDSRNFSSAFSPETDILRSSPDKKHKTGPGIVTYSRVRGGWTSERATNKEICVIKTNLLAWKLMIANLASRLITTPSFTWCVRGFFSRLCFVAVRGPTSNQFCLYNSHNVSSNQYRLSFTFSLTKLSKNINLNIGNCVSIAVSRGAKRKKILSGV